MFKHSRNYQKDFLGTVEEDAKDMFIQFKELYEEKKDTKESYIPALKKFIMCFEKHFE